MFSGWCSHLVPGWFPGLTCGGGWGLVGRMVGLLVVWSGSWLRVIVGVLVGALASFTCGCLVWDVWLVSWLVSWVVVWLRFLVGFLGCV